MTPLQWVTLFADFVGIVPRLVDAFAEENPELRTAPPPPDAEGSLLNAALDSAARKFSGTEAETGLDWDDPYEDLD